MKQTEKKSGEEERDNLKKRVVTLKNAESLDFSMTTNSSFFLEKEGTEINDPFERQQAG